MEEDRVLIDTSDDDGMVDVSGYFADDAAQAQEYHSSFADVVKLCDFTTIEGICVTTAMLGAMYERRKRQRQRSAVVLVSLVTTAMQLYARRRGGFQAVLCFTMPDVPTSFDLDRWPEKEAVFWFRLSALELRRVAAALHIAEVIITPSRDRAPGLEVLAMLCMKYAWPTRLGEMLQIFGTSVGRLSRLISALRRDLYTRFSPRMRNPRILNAQDVELFGKVIEQKSGHKGIFCFIDGTVRPILKPQDLQNANYSGKNRVHALKYQMICTPDGIMQHIGGPWPGSRHDQWCLNDSNILDWVRRHGCSAEGVSWSTYADAGYSELPGLVRPWPDGNLDVAHQAYNTTMASSRICVEWEFGHIIQYWAALQMRVQQKLLDGSRPGQQYFVAALLTNCLNCLQPNNTSQYFSVVPPALEEYIAGLLQ